MHETNQEARTFGMLCHLAALAGYVIPFGNIIGPLIFWLLKRDQHPFVDQQGKEALNFQISVILYLIVAGILCIIFIGLLLLPIIGVASLVFIIIAGVRANSGESYRYPLTIRFIK
ncbi:DUF4870 domain-containing protein [Tumebacillus permanentifrigoris]|uniref:Tic20 family protein n=1 Tax=Tumebacillus permanentifrigoris TaxID=378543 RepID=A0A316DGH4_9BACL|nr:DUF4870 domain-containing protein [Tumebacillus permanentifrigoris]PWK16339.1 hypothetical protein C7459_101203 [Tumebacillus permanentifrigoris]